LNVFGGGLRPAIVCADVLLDPSDEFVLVVGADG
jgi:hypothetical protein